MVKTKETHAFQKNKNGKHSKTANYLAAAGTLETKMMKGSSNCSGRSAAKI